MEEPATPPGGVASDVRRSVSFEDGGRASFQSSGGSLHADAPLEHVHPGLHIFFIWVDPRDATSNTLGEWPLPAKYSANVAAWQGRYGVDAMVYSGQDCVTFVAAVDRDEGADCGGLLDVYLELASAKNWIKMVDVARVAIMWLKVSETRANFCPRPCRVLG